MPVGRRFAYEGENVAAMHFTVELRDSNSIDNLQKTDSELR